LSAGTKGYLLKTQAIDDVVRVTSREREVLQLVAEGMTTRKIASIKTAECHRHRIMDKLDIHDTASLVRYSIRRRLIEP